MIHQGSKGGFFTVDSSGKKKYKVSFAYNIIEPKNSKGNVIHQGSKGGLYIIKGGKKIYNFSPIPKSQYPPILNKVKKTIAGSVIGKTVSKYIQSKKPATNKKGNPLVKTATGKYYKLSATGKSKTYVKNVIKPPTFTLGKPKLPTVTETVPNYNKASLKKLTKYQLTTLFTKKGLPKPSAKMTKDGMIDILYKKPNNTTLSNQKKEAAGKKLAHLVTTKFYDKLLGIALKRQKYKWDKIARELVGDFAPHSPGAHHNPAKYVKAAMYRKAILRYMRIHKWTQPIFRGLSLQDASKYTDAIGQVVHAKSFSQFSRTLGTALVFGKTSHSTGRKLILMIPSGTPVPAVQYYGEDKQGNVKFEKLVEQYPSENEILLPPGDFVVQALHQRIGYTLVEVKFKPDYNPTETLIYDKLNKVYKEVSSSKPKTKHYQSPILKPTVDSHGIIKDTIWNP